MQRGILEPCLNLYVEGGRLLDLRNELKAVGKIVMWGGENVQRVVKKLKHSGLKTMPNTSPKCGVARCNSKENEHL